MSEDLRCPECGSQNICKNGYQPLTRTRKRVPRFRCKDCARVFLREYTEHGKAVVEGRKRPLA